jgi:hypothetical protein
MWRHIEAAEEDVPNVPGIDLQRKCRRSRRHPWRDGAAEQTVVVNIEDARSYRAFARAIAGSVDPSLSLRSFVG